jgi:tRNA nucleotidyltransferase (CCA-adding enzyme)
VPGVSGSHTIRGAEETIERLARLPGGPELLAQARTREQVALVGGAVRDLLLGHWPRELDVTVSRDSAALATALAAAISPSERPYGHAVEPILHERFGTASVVWDYGRIDIAELRAESYPAPGALPEVRPGSVEEDLARRDFTVNAISLPLAGAQRGRLLATDGALQDLQAGTLRVLHERSFRDDPTRILRLARYAARLRFEIEPVTRRLAGEALEGGALGSVSGSRVAAELWLAAREDDAPAALAALGELGVLQALGLPARFDGGLAAEAEALLPADGDRDVLLLAVATHPGDGAGGPELLARIRELELPGELLDRVFPAPAGAAGLAQALEAPGSAAAAAAALEGHSVESVALAAALAARRSERAGAAGRDWLETQRHIALEIDGHDLLAAGVPEGPEVGARLAGALRRKREGKLQSREQELLAALEAETEEPRR